MKQLLTITTLLLTKGVIIDPAFAAGRAETVCITSERVADAGYALTISPDMRSAELLEQTIMGPRTVARMSCDLLPVRRYPDALNNYLLCRDSRNIEQGLIARVFSGGIAGLHYASLRELSRIGRHAQEREIRFGHLNCRRGRN